MNKIAFRQGFLRGLAENGFTPERLEQAIAQYTKCAAAGAAIDAHLTKESVDGTILDARYMTPLLIGAGLVAAPVAVGAAGGYVGANVYHGLTADPAGKSIEDIKNDEIAKEIALNKLERKKKLAPAGLSPLPTSTQLYGPSA